MKQIPESSMTEKGDPPEKYTVYYPSGQILIFDGVYAVAIVKGEFYPVMRLVDKDVFLDPRAVITRPEGWIYHPRNNPQIPKWVSDWLTENPAWPSKEFVSD